MAQAEPDHNEGSIVTDDVYDDTEKEDVTPDVSYDVTSYGSDPDVEGLVRRLSRNEIVVPSFQRDFVWRQPEASRFIESLLLGLPVPGIFLATEAQTNKLVVIDGQQRLKSLSFFYGGFFNPKPSEKRHKVFALQKVQQRFTGKTYATLEEPDRLRLGNSVIHATIVKQVAPPDDTSVYHIFERLNSGGRKLTAQEIRVALYHGPFMDAIRTANSITAWRELFGKPHTRLKDQELVIRFLALYVQPERYERPMSEFLSKFCGRQKAVDQQVIDAYVSKFHSCIDLFWSALKREAFRPTRAINAAVFDSCMVGLAKRLERDPLPHPQKVAEAYRNLMEDSEYKEATGRSTADEAFVKRRLEKAARAFSEL